MEAPSKASFDLCGERKTASRRLAACENSRYFFLCLVGSTISYF